MADHRIRSVATRFAKEPEYYRSDRRELLQLLPAEARRILDVGCGAGRSWHDDSREVHGIEFDANSAAEARRHLQQVHVGDVEKVQLPYSPGYFDVLVFADIVEHLYDPWGALLRLRPLLAESGHVLLSIPNVRYYKILQRLLWQADFGYETEGVLDIDHVRFFARRNVQWMLKETGLEVVRWENYQRGSSRYRLLNRLCFGGLSDFLTKQYMVLARPVPGWQPPAGEVDGGKAITRPVEAPEQPAANG